MYCDGPQIIEARDDEDRDYRAFLVEAENAEEQQLPRGTALSETLVVSSRGRITLPAEMRKRLGLRAGDILILEDRGAEIVLKPCTVVETQNYSADQIAEWDKADRLSDHERMRVLDGVDGRPPGLPGRSSP